MPNPQFSRLLDQEEAARKSAGVKDIILIYLEEVDIPSHFDFIGHLWPHRSREEILPWSGDT